MNKINKIKILSLLIISLITISIGMTYSKKHTENKNIKDTFYRSVKYDPDKDLLSFTIPKSIPKGYKFYLHVSGSLFMGSKFHSMSFHAFEEESVNYSWIKGKTYMYPINSEGLDFCLLVFGLIDKDKHELFYSIHIISNGMKCIEKTN